MPTRMIRDGILTSERINMLTERAELFYRRLMSVADDYGRFSANLTLLRSSCYPLKIDSVKEDSIKKHLAEAADAGLIVLFTVDGKAYLEIQDFGQRVQSKSKYPEPPEGSRVSTVEHGGPPNKTDVVGGVVEGEGEGEGVTTTRQRRTRKPETSIPEDFGISDRVKAWAEEKGHGRLEAHLEAFKLKAVAKDYRYADWDSAFMTAIREDWAKLGNSPKTTVNHGGNGDPPKRKRLGEGSSTDYGVPGIGRQGGEA